MNNRSLKNNTLDNDNGNNSITTIFTTDGVLTYYINNLVPEVGILGMDYVQLNLAPKSHQIPKLKCFSSRLAVVFAQYIEAMC